MSEERNGDSKQCPNCGADMAEGAVICTQCGFDARSGEVLDTEGDDKAPSRPLGTPPGVSTELEEEYTPPKASRASKITKLVLLLLVAGGIGVGAFFLLRAPRFVLEGKKIEQKIWKKGVEESQLWQMYFAHRLASTDRKRPWVRFRIFKETEGAMELRGPTTKFTILVLHGTSGKQLSSCEEMGRNISVREITANALRAAAIRTLATCGKNDPAMVAKLIKGLQDGSQGLQGAFISALDQVGPPAEEAAPLLLEIVQESGESGLRENALCAYCSVLGYDPENRKLLSALYKALNGEDSGLTKVASGIFVKMGKPALPALEKIVKQGTPKTKKIAEKLILKINPPPPKKKPWRLRW